MKKRGNFILVIIIFYFIFFPNIIYAKQGCCSHHGGVVGCSGGRQVCADGSYSPTCTCGTYNSNSSNSSSSSLGNSSYKPSNSNSTDDSKYAGIAVTGILGGLITLGIISEKQDAKKAREEYLERVESERKKYNPTIDEYNEQLLNFINKNKEILNKLSKNSIVINVKINNMKTQLQTWLETDVTSYTYRGRTYYETLSRDLYFKNVGITKGSFELYRSDIFNFNNLITTSTKNVKIYDSNKNIRKYFELRADKITSRNIKRSKKVVNKKNKYMVMLIIEEKSDKIIKVEIDLYNLKKLASICGNIAIIEE